MENMNIFQNPGLQHTTENILLNVDLDDLPKCQLLNKSCQDILDNPMFWTKKFRMLKRLSEENYIDSVRAFKWNTNFDIMLWMFGCSIILMLWMRR